MFDIDKLYLSRKNYRKVTKEDMDWINASKETTDSLLIHAEGNVYDIKHKKLTDRFEKGSLEYLQNRLLDEYIALLCDAVEDENGVKVPRSVHLLHASIDSHTDLIKDVVKDFESGVKQDALSPFNAYMLRKQCATKDAFKTGKFGIGPFALNNNSHILTMLYNVSFDDKGSGILVRLKKTRLDRHSDDDGRSILAWLSGLINIHVDAAKDPIADKLNIGKFTYNLVNLMIRTGFGKKTFWFTSQPIMRVLGEAYNNAQASYMANQQVSSSKRFSDSKENIIINFAKANGYDESLAASLESVISTWKNSIYEDLKISANDLVDYLLSDGAEILRNVSKNQYGDNKNLSSDLKYNVTIKGKEAVISFFDVQMAVFVAKEQLDVYAEALSDLVKYTKIDTKKQGKTISEQQLYLRGVNKLFGKDSKSPTRRLFNTKSLDRLYEQSFILHKTEKATQAFLSIMGNVSIQGTRQFQDLVSELMTMTGNDDFGNAKTIRTISGELLAKRKSEFFTRYAEENDIDIDELFNGQNTLCDKLGRIKIIVATDPRYAHLRDADGEVNNYMLKTLTQGYAKLFSNSLLGAGEMNDQYNNAKFLDTFTFIDDESVDADAFSEAWEDLLFDDTIPEIQQFAKELIVYSFFTAGDNGGNHDLFKFVPNSWKVNPYQEWITTDEPYSEDSYAKFMVDLLTNYRTSGVKSRLTEEDVDDIILNNWFDHVFIKEEKIIKNGETRFIEVYSGQVYVDEEVLTPDGLVTLAVLRKVSFPSILLAITVTLDGVHPTFDPRDTPMYIKIRRTSCLDKESQRRYVIYKYAGEGLRYDGGVEMYYPIYVQVDPRGNKLQRGNRILQYGRTTKRNEAVNTMLNANPLFAKFRKHVENDLALLSLPKLFNRTVNAFATKWDSLTLKNTAVAAGYVGDVLRDAARRIRPDDIPLEVIEEWSKKEGWSVDHFFKRVYPNRNEAWQIEFEYTETDELAKFFGNMDYSFGEDGRPDLTSTNTIDAIRNGERTSTTRFEHDGHIDYWQQVLPGDIIEFKNDRGDSVKVRCTNRLTKLTDVFGITESEQQPSEFLEVEPNVKNIPQSYEGLIEPEEDVIFVFGSNPEGRHGAGAAKVAVDKFGAIYGQGEGLQGNSYAIPTKDLRVAENNGLRSISSEQIIESIKKMYNVARQYPNKQFKVAYTNNLNEATLNGYTGEEMLEMFKAAGPIPENVYFSKNWTDSWDYISRC